MPQHPMAFSYAPNPYVVHRPPLALQPSGAYKRTLGYSMGDGLMPAVVGQQQPSLNEQVEAALRYPVRPHGPRGLEQVLFMPGVDPNFYFSGERRRCRNACKACWERKSRCTMLKNGSCLNCVERNQECIPRTHLRKRANHGGEVAAPTSSPELSDSELPKAKEFKIIADTSPPTPATPMPTNVFMCAPSPMAAASKGDPGLPQAPLCGSLPFYLGSRPGMVMPSSHLMQVHSGTQAMLVPTSIMPQAVARPPLPSPSLVTAAGVPAAVGGWQWQPYAYAA